MPENTIYFHPTKKIKFARAFNHLVPGVLPLLIGIESLSYGDAEHLVFALLGIGAGAALIVSFVRDMRQTAHAGLHSVHWFDIFAGIVIFGSMAQIQTGERLSTRDVVVWRGSTFMLSIFLEKPKN